MPEFLLLANLIKSKIVDFHGHVLNVCDNQENNIIYKASFHLMLRCIWFRDIIAILEVN